MKILYIGILFCALDFNIWAQVPLPAQAKEGNASTFQNAASFSVIQRGENRTVWESTMFETNAMGDVIPHAHRYEEIANGQNYRDPQSGEWVESKELIEISPAGGAEAVHGLHKAYFPYDIYDGVIELVTPDGRHLKSRPLEIAYSDYKNSIMIAELKHSVGQILPSGNQVIYTNAFTDFDADLICTYRKGGFESDLVIRQAPLAPEAFGLDSKAASLELLTEFFDTPEPQQTTSIPKSVQPSSNKSGANPLPDASLRFGAMRMIRGKAFSMNAAQTVPEASGNPGPFPWQEPDLSVSKTWAQLEGRTFLIEAIPFQNVSSQLKGLSLADQHFASAKSSGRVLKPVSSRWLPPTRLVRQNRNPLLLAKADIGNHTGVVLDYITVNLNQTDFTFAGDTTYFISTGVFFTGNVTIEGGTVIKFPANSNSFIYVDGGTITCRTAPYHPAIFTSKDDNTVGETISGSSGIPTVGDYACLGAQDMLLDLHDLRTMYGWWGIFNQTDTAKLRDIQVLHSQIGVQSFYCSNCIVQNVLMSDIREQAFEAYESSISVEHLTLDQCPLLGYNDWNSTLRLTNSLFTGVTVMSGFGAIPYVSNSIVVLSTNTGVFQTVGAGSYYLANNSIYRDAGATNIDPGLLTDLRQKTTYPPVLYTNVMVSTNTTFSPQALRDVDVPDIGYHYDSIDYLVDQYAITNATLTVSPGTTIASYGDSGIVAAAGSTISSIGTVPLPIWYIKYFCAQEEPITRGSSPSSSLMVNPYHLSAPPVGQYRLSKFSTVGSMGYLLYHGLNNWSYSNLLVQDCEFWGGLNSFSGNNNTSANFKNNLFVRSFISASGTGTTNNFLILSNNLFWNGIFTAVPFSNSNSWILFNNTFDHSTNTFGFGSPNFVHGYNAYIGDTNVTKRLTPIGTHDILVATNLAYQSGPLGSFYLFASSPLINSGSVTADLASLYHYTTTTNQVKETNSMVDIGYHYVALDGLGNAVDTDGDGIPDYLEDSNGNGAFDSGSDLGNWQINQYNGLTQSAGLQVFTPLK